MRKNCVFEVGKEGLKFELRGLKFEVRRWEHAGAGTDQVVVGALRIPDELKPKPNVCFDEEAGSERGTFQRHRSSSLRPKVSEVLSVLQRSNELHVYN